MKSHQAVRITSFLDALYNLPSGKLNVAFALLQVHLTVDLLNMTVLCFSGQLIQVQIHFRIRLRYVGDN